MKSVRISQRVLVTVFTLILTASAAHAAAPELISQNELLGRIEAGKAPLILDVRTGGEYSRGHVPGAVNIPHTKLADRIKRISDHRFNEVVVYCEQGPRANFAEIVLQQNGFQKVRHLDGDMSAWRDAGLPVDR